MDVKQIRSVLLCVTCIFFMPGNAVESSTDVLYELLFKRMDDVMFEHKLLRREFDEAVRNMGNQADRITNVEDATNKIEKQADKMANFDEAIAKIKEQAIKISNLEEITNKMEKKADKMPSFEEAINRFEEQAIKITNLEAASRKMEKQADKMASFEEAINKTEEHAIKIFNFEEAANKIEKQAADKMASFEEAIKKIQEQDLKISNLEKTTDKMEKKADKIANLEEVLNKTEEQGHKIANLEDKIVHLEEVTNKMEKQVDRITKLEDCVKKIENKNKEVTNIENAVQHLNNKIEELENNTFNNKKAISDMTQLAMENDLKAVNVSESSINAIKDDVTKQSAVVRKMVSAEKIFLRKIKMSLHEKFLSFTNKVKLQMSTLNTSVESQVSSFKTILKETEKNVSVALNNYSSYTNDTFFNFSQNISKFANEYELKLETLQDEMDKESDHHRKTLNKASGEIQQLKTRQGTLQDEIDKNSDHTKALKTTNDEIQRLETKMVNVERRQGKRAAFTVLGASRQSNGILKFSDVKLNEGSVYDSTTGKFTSPYAGIYGFTASIIEYGSGDNYIYCEIRKNGYGYVVVRSWRGKIDGRRATHGRGTGTAAATLHLVKGDSVHVWCSSSTGTALYLSSFSGFLINPDP
ncbi:nuclease SbcCD subunit C-like isoform X3 [Mercenaria mercenaria]|uniref:nuclease SbcCD subunit C-like isoform X3 n=1 Tax=Mercenaria mercenaria TaxID=6596 RepID=UPI00234EAD3B|nr:nuclease SbcCD subunit C-like isoform X3 [Mercenaria mercenaria]